MVLVAICRRGYLVEARFESNSLVIVLCGLIALFAPVQGVARVDLLSTFVLDVDSLGQVQEACLADGALHVGLGNQLGMVVWGALSKGNLLLLESVRVRLVGFVALEAEGEVVALGAVEAELALGDGLHAAVATEP